MLQVTQNWQWMFETTSRNTIYRGMYELIEIMLRTWARRNKFKISWFPILTVPLFMFFGIALWLSHWLRLNKLFNNNDNTRKDGRTLNRHASPYTDRWLHLWPKVQSLRISKQCVWNIPECIPNSNLVMYLLILQHRLIVYVDLANKGCVGGNLSTCSCALLSMKPEYNNLLIVLQSLNANMLSTFSIHQQH